MRNLQNVRVKVNSSYEKICPFPIGYIYLSTNSTSPASTYGGNWSALTDSRFLRPAGSWNGTGGESTHVLSVEEMPSHRHGIGVILEGYQQSGATAYVQYQTYSLQGTLYTTNTGGGKAHNNLPPYRNCYAWYRTS